MNGNLLLAMAEVKDLVRWYMINKIHTVDTIDWINVDEVSVFCEFVTFLPGKFGEINIFYIFGIPMAFYSTVWNSIHVFVRSLVKKI